MRRFLAVLRARNLEFMRDRSVLAWNLVLPFVIVFGFAFAFSGGPRDSFRVGVHGPIDAASTQLEFFETRYIRFLPVRDLPQAIQKVERHQLDMVLDLQPGRYRYWVNAESPNGYILERVLWASGTHQSARPPPGRGAPQETQLAEAVRTSPRDEASAAALFQKQSVEGREIRYVDWLLPGVLAMNIMFSALFGVGYVIVRYRKNGVLKRLKATPLSAFEFLCAQVVSRLWLILVVTTLLYLGTRLVLDVPMYGSYVGLLLVLLLGALCMISLGLIVAARVASEELAGGLLNVFTWPMMFLSGIWFSTEGIHPWLQTLAQGLPLTHAIEAARAIMFDGAGLLAVGPQLAVLAGMTVFFLLVSSMLFRWE
jgi:ABC-2 type transport system permease protein